MFKKNKILFVQQDFKYLLRFRSDLIMSLSNKYDVYTLNQNFREYENLDNNFYIYKVPSFNLKILDLMLFYTSLIFIMFKIKPNIVMSFNTIPVVMCSFIKFFFKLEYIHIPTITGLGNFYIGKTKSVIKKLIRSLAIRLINKKAEFIIFQNIDDKNYYEKTLYPNKLSKFKIVNGSGIKIRETKSKKLTKNISFGMLSRIIKGKGIDEFLSAAKRINDEFKNINFLFGGTFPKSFFSYSKKKFLENCSTAGINFLGEVKDINTFFDDIDVFVLPSYREGTPRSVLEAMLFYKPIITTNAPGCKETVINNYNGITINPGNSFELYESIKYFILNTSQISTYGKNSRAFLEEKFDLKTIIAQYNKILQNYD